MSRRTKSVEEPPICRPILAPPTEYIAGADHLPLKFWPVRQSKGPRPPLPPTPNPNFFTSGRISTQLAFDNRPGEMSLLLSISCNTRLACRRVSSSFSLSAAMAGRISNAATMEVKHQHKAFPEVCLDSVCCINPSPFSVVAFWESSKEPPSRKGLSGNRHFSSCVLMAARDFSSDDRVLSIATFRTILPLAPVNPACSEPFTVTR